MAVYDPDIDPSDLKFLNQAIAQAKANSLTLEQQVAAANAIANQALGISPGVGAGAPAGTGSPFGQTGSYVDNNGTPFGQAGSNPATGGSVMENYIAGIPTNTPYSPGNFRRAEEASNKAFYDANPEYVAEMMRGPQAPSNVTQPQQGTSSSTTDALLQQIIAQNNAAAAAAAKASAQSRQSAIDVVTARFKAYGLESLAAKIKELAVDGATEATITLALQETDEYKTRFKANQARLKAGLQVLQPAEYLNVEDGYRQVLRSYGMNQFATDEYVQKFIENDLSAKELSDRVTIAVQQVQNADPAILMQLKDYYGIGATDAAAYILDPNQQISKIQRQVAAAQIGVAARKQGLESNVAVSEQLAAQGISQAEAQKGYATIADILPTAEKLSKIYGDIGTYDQSTAEQEMFNQLASAQRKRQQLTAREIASFSGSSGLARGGLSEGKTAGQV